MLSTKLLTQMLTVSLGCLLSLPAMAQAVRGQVRGLVTDQTGSVLPGAKVTLSNVNTGVITVKPTDNAGIYVFDFVEPGTYTVTVESGGFARHVQQNLVVQSGSELTVGAPESCPSPRTANTSTPLVAAFVAFVIAVAGGRLHSLALLILAALILDAAVQLCQVLSLRSIYMLAPESRGRLNGLFIACAFLGGATGSGLAPAIYTFDGWGTLANIGVLFVFAALVLYLSEFPYRGRRTP